jgi:hypothetical protein
VIFSERSIRGVAIPGKSHGTTLAIVYALKEWRPYVHGSCFVIKTNHHPLRYLDTQSNLSKRQMRWMETLQEYDYEIVYVQGKFNVVADAFSRINESPSTALYVGSEDDEDSDVVALNVVGTVSRPMLSESMVSDLQKIRISPRQQRRPDIFITRRETRNRRSNFSSEKVGARLGCALQKKRIHTSPSSRPRFLFLAFSFADPPGLPGRLPSFSFTYFMKY